MDDPGGDRKGERGAEADSTLRFQLFRGGVTGCRVGGKMVYRVYRRS